MLELFSHNPQATMDCGAKVGRLLRPGDLVNIDGTLGAGKTVLVKGICRGSGVLEDEVTSPTFSLINQYYGTYPVYHFDLYRLETGSELEGIGYEEYFYGDGIALVEWGNRFAHYLPPERLDITMEQVDEGERRIVIGGHSGRGLEILQRLKEDFVCMS